MQYSTNSKQNKRTLTQTQRNTMTPVCLKAFGNFDRDSLFFFFSRNIEAAKFHDNHCCHTWHWRGPLTRDAKWNLQTKSDAERPSVSATLLAFGFYQLSYVCKLSVLSRSNLQTTISASAHTLFLSLLSPRMSLGIQILCKGHKNQKSCFCKRQTGFLWK